MIARIKSLMSNAISCLRGLKCLLGPSARRPRRKPGISLILMQEICPDGRHSRVSCIRIELHKTDEPVSFVEESNGTNHI